MYKKKKKMKQMIKTYSYLEVESKYHSSISLYITIEFFFVGYHFKKIPIFLIRCSSSKGNIGIETLPKVKTGNLNWKFIPQTALSPKELSGTT